MAIYMDRAELAELMGMSTSSLERLLKIRPQAVPPKMHFAASNML